MIQTKVLLQRCVPRKPDLCAYLTASRAMHSVGVKTQVPEVSNDTTAAVRQRSIRRSTRSTLHYRSPTCRVHFPFFWSSFFFFYFLFFHSRSINTSECAIKRFSGSISISSRERGLERITRTTNCRLLFTQQILCTRYTHTQTRIKLA